MREGGTSELKHGHIEQVAVHTSPCILPRVALLAMGALRLRRACALLACGATLLYNVRRLVAQQGDAPEAAAACALARQLELALPSPPSETGSDTAADDEVRLGTSGRENKLRRREGEGEGERRERGGERGESTRKRGIREAEQAARI